MRSRKVLAVFFAVWLFLMNMLPAFAAGERDNKQKELDEAQHNVQVAEEKKEALLDLAKKLINREK